MPYLGSNFILRFQQVSSVGKIDRGKKVLKKFINGQKVFSQGGNKRYYADRGPRQGFILPEQLLLFSIYSFLSGTQHLEPIFLLRVFLLQLELIESATPLSPWQHRLIRIQLSKHNQGQGNYTFPKIEAMFFSSLPDLSNQKHNTTLEG